MYKTLQDSQPITVIATVYESFRPGMSNGARPLGNATWPGNRAYRPTFLEFPAAAHIATSTASDSWNRSRLNFRISQPHRFSASGNEAREREPLVLQGQLYNTAERSMPAEICCERHDGL